MVSENALRYSNNWDANSLNLDKGIRNCSLLPLTTTISMGFKETQLLTKTDIDAGY